MAVQIKSKKRVTDLGEVYTNKSEVTGMLDLVETESFRIDSRFLEPACGNGNFLEEILRRKMKTIMKNYKKSQIEYERYTFLAVSSIYGIDIMEDNCKEARERLFKIIKIQYKKLYKDNALEDFLNAIDYILLKNIICGDGLTGLQNGELAKPIIFSEWTMIKSMVKRKDYAMNDMIAYEEFSTPENEILQPRKEFEIINYKEVQSLE